jgi:hypothetical protein
MKELTTLIIILVAGQTFGQTTKPKKFIVDNKANYSVDKLNQLYQSIYQSVTELDNGTIETTTITDTVTADLKVNYDPKRRDTEQIYINSSTARLSGDSLIVNLFHHGLFIWEYDIIIFRKQFQITSWFKSPISHHVVKIKPLISSLKINSSNFKKGNVLKGYTKLRGKCEGNERECFSKDVLIEGSFNVKIE